MLLFLVIALAMVSQLEPPAVAFGSTLAGGPDQLDMSLKVQCGETVYSFNFSATQGYLTTDFDRAPTPPSADLSIDVIEALGQFSGVPLLEAWCPVPRAGETVRTLWLEATGPLTVSDKEARESCIKRGGMFDHKSWRKITLEANAVYIDGDEIGKCTTKEDIEDFNRLIGG